MFRIRRIFDDLLPVDAAAIEHSREILKAHFPAAPQGEFDNLSDKLRNPLLYRFRPAFLVVALGLDTAKADPDGTWTLRARDFQKNGRLVGGLGLPTLVVQEGGYRVPSLSANALRFFTGLHEGLYAQSRNRRTP